MFREMRRIKQKISNEECIRVLKTQPRGVLSMIGDDGYPYGIPMDHWYSETDNTIYFHCAKVGHKIDAIRKYDKASFCVIDQDDVHPEKYTTFFRSVIAFGRIHIIEDDAEKMKAARLLGNRYNPNHEEALQKELEKGFSRMLVIRFDIEHLTGKEAIELMKRREQGHACL